MSPRRVALALAALGLVSLLLVPIATAPANVAGDCGQLVGSQQKEARARDAWTMLFEEQRQEAVCDDARSARWIYVSLSAALLVLLATRVRARPWTVVLGALGGLVAVAAALDGPIVPLALVALGALVGVRWRWREGDTS